MATKFTDIYVKALSVLTQQEYEAEWHKFLHHNCVIRSLLTQTGFAPSCAGQLDTIRAKLKKDAEQSTIGKVFLKAAKGSNEAGSVNERAATLKLLQNLYRVAKSGGQDVWVYSPPAAFSQWLFDEITGDESAVEAKLNHDEEIFSQKEMEWMAGALKIALKISEDAKVALGKSNTATKDMVQRWFFEHAPTDAELKAAITTLSQGFNKIAVACNSNTLLFTDYANWRSERNRYYGAAYRGGEGGGFPVVYLEGAFTRLTGNTGKQWQCVVTIIHEMSHLELNTRDHRYDSSGLKPNKNTLPFAKAIENAESWAYFALDLAGYLSEADRIAAWK